MRMTSKVKITGFRKVDTTVDGVKYDSTKVAVETSLDDSRGMARGAATTFYDYKTSQEYDRFVQVPVPFEAECEFEMVTNGKSSKMILHNIKPISVAKQA